MEDIAPVTEPLDRRAGRAAGTYHVGDGDVSVAEHERVRRRRHGQHEGEGGGVRGAHRRVVRVQSEGVGLRAGNTREQHGARPRRRHAVLPPVH